MSGNCVTQPLEGHTSGSWTRPCNVQAICIPEHGLWRNVWGKRFFLVLSFSGRHEQKLVKVSHAVENR